MGQICELIRCCPVTILIFLLNNLSFSEADVREGTPRREI
jgi:hypothetical protein